MIFILGRSPACGGDLRPRAEGYCYQRRRRSSAWGRTHSGGRFPRLADMTLRQVMAWWHAWSSDGPRPTAPGRAASRAAAAIGRHAMAVDAVLAVVAAAGTVPQLSYHATHSDRRLGALVLFSALLVVPLSWRRRFPLTTFAFAAIVALAQWLAGVQLAADLALLIYLYTVASRYPMRVAIVAAGVAEVGAAAVRRPLAIDPVVGRDVRAAVRSGRRRRDAGGQRAAPAQRPARPHPAGGPARTRTRPAGHDRRGRRTDPHRPGDARRGRPQPVRHGDAVRGGRPQAGRRTATGRRGDAPGVGHRPPGPRRDAPAARRTAHRAGTGRPPSPTRHRAARRPARSGPVDRPDRRVGRHRHARRNAARSRVDGLPHRAGSPDQHAQARDRPPPGQRRHHPRARLRDRRGARRRGSPAGRPNAGHGLAGMRERAAVYAGQVSAGPDPGGGWRVRANLALPVEAAASGSAR